MGQLQRPFTEDDLNVLIDATLKTFENEIVPFPEFESQLNDRNRAGVDAFVVINRDTLRNMVSILTKEAVGITDSLSDIREMVETFGHQFESPVVKAQRAICPDCERGRRGYCTSTRADKLDCYEIAHYVRNMENEKQD